MEIEQDTYRNKTLAVSAVDEGLCLSIDGKQIATKLPSSEEGYTTPLFAYRSFESLMELGKAVIREGCWSQISHGGNE